MAKIPNLVGDNSVSFDAFGDEVDFVIATDGNLDDAIGITLQDQIDGYVNSPLDEALMEADEDPDFSGSGDRSMKIDIDQDFSGVAPKADMLDIAADDLIAAERDLAYDDLTDDAIIDLVNDMK